MDSIEKSKNELFDLDSFLKDIKTKKKTEDKPFLDIKQEKPSSMSSKNNSVNNSSIPKQSLPQKVIKKEPDVEEIKDDKEKAPSLDKLERNYRIFPGCKFCDIIHHQKDKIIFEDDLCAAFHDKNRINSQEHILLCSKSHIKNSHCVPKENISLLTHLQDTGETLLKKRRPNDSYRFGYHEPPMNSIEHLHLHCIVLPITSEYLDKVIYGFKLASTEKIIKKIQSGEITPGVYPEKVKKTKTK